VRTSYVVRNETPRRLVIKGRRGAELVLAPLEERVFGESPRRDFRLDLLEDRRQLTVEEREEFEQSYVAAVGAGFLALIVYVVLGAVLGEWLWGGLILLFVIPSGYVLTTGKRAAALQSLRRLRPYGAQLATLVLALVIGVGIPGGVIYAGTDLRDAIDAAVAGASTDATHAILVGRGLQLVFVAAFALVPALLYFLSDREQLCTQRERFTGEVFRLDPGVATLSDVRAKYGGLMQEVYGAPARLRDRVLRGRRSPILVATLVISLGWVLTLLNATVGQEGRASSATAIAEILQPVNNIVAFGFLGAYFFALQAILRGYMRGDLRPKTYTGITARIMIVTILAWVLERVLPGGAYLFALAFLAGVVPETALLRVQELVRGKTREWKRLPALTERNPLTSLQGIDLYDRARLADEGVTNVEGLANADLVELMLKTRIPPASLVDWTDQAVLYLHAGDDRDDGGREETLARLQRHGIRTATDVLNANAAARKRGEGEALLARLDGDDSGRMEVVLSAIADEEWVTALRYWRSAVHQRDRVLRVRAVPTSGKEVVEGAAEEPEEVEAGNGHPLALRA
jgi:hypothetical protein